MNFKLVLKLEQKYFGDTLTFEFDPPVEKYYSTIFEKLKSGKCIIKKGFNNWKYPFQFYGEHCEICNTEITDDIWMESYDLVEKFAIGELKWSSKEEQISILTYILFFCSKGCRAMFGKLPEDLVRLVLPNVTCKVCGKQYPNNFTDIRQSHLNKRVWYYKGEIYDTLDCWRKRGE